MQLYDWVAEVVESRPIEATATENDLDFTKACGRPSCIAAIASMRRYARIAQSPLRSNASVVVGLEEVFPVVDVRDDEGLDNPELKDASASKQNERCFDSSERAVAIANTIPVEVANKAMALMLSSPPCRFIVMTSCAPSGATLQEELIVPTLCTRVAF